jgi:hypothetical protein
VQKAITPEARENLERFLASHTADSDQIVARRSSREGPTARSAARTC